MRSPLAISRVALVAALASGAFLLAPPAIAQSAAEKPWPWPESADAVAAAPDSHEVLIDNESVRVLRVRIEPGEREPAHTHRWPSVMIVDGPARIRYYDADGKLRFETPEGREAASEPHPNWMGPEGLHAVENIDDRPFLAWRIELKDG